MKRILEFSNDLGCEKDCLENCAPRGSKRLTYRVLTGDDAREFMGVCDDPLIAENIPFISANFGLHHATALLASVDRRRDCFFGVFNRQTMQLMGVVGAHLSARNDIEIGYWLRPDCHGQGFAFEAVKTVIEGLELAFPDRRIVAQCRPENVPSWRLLMKLGFVGLGDEGAREGRHFLVRGRANSQRARPDDID